MPGGPLSAVAPYRRSSPLRRLYHGSVTHVEEDPGSGLVLLTGATGYVGGRLLRALAERGRRVRCLARRSEALAARAPSNTEVVQGDCLRRETLDPALAGVHTAYYLVHSMAAGAAFEEQDRAAARNFGEAARAAGVRKIIYLGGLGEAGARLSPHLRSRQETGDVLRAASGLPVVELRASVVLGSGSLSFELVRALVERLPAARLWLFTKTAKQEYTSVAYERGDVLVFGCESSGLPPSLLAEQAERTLRIPIRPEVRSLNLSNSVAVALYEARRQGV